MPTKRRKPKTYKELKTLWYAKLKADGFEDIERSEDMLKVWSTTFTMAVPNSSTPIQLAAKEAYYRFATHFLNDYQFETLRDKIVWEYHSNGMSMRNIVETLKKVKIKTNRDNICDTVNRLARIMKSMYGITS
jgi:hypothetical protein